MTDRELLEAAAKAAGIVPIREWCGDGPGGGIAISMRFQQIVFWNPLTDDGDALRLAVKLGLIVDTHGMHTRISLPYCEAMCYEKHNGDPLAATRRAIVRAAVALGEKP